MKIYSYVVARDFGFAPNPFHNFCTLATCRPDIRQKAQIGDWIIGTGSTKNQAKTKLVYAMKVEEKLEFQEYFSDPRFQQKKPDLTKSTKFHYGDNIYSKGPKNEWIALDSHHYIEGGSKQNIQHDTSQPVVLISTNFVYFGKDSIQIPEHLHFLIKSGQGTRCVFEDSQLNTIEAWLVDLIKTSKGLQGFPIDWK